MNKKRTIAIAVLLLLSIVNYTRISGGENIRAIQFLSIFSIGMLSGLLLFEVAGRLKNKTN
jgi:TM2 domain-containing membrane protein YozV